MNTDDKVKQLTKLYDIINILDLNEWFSMSLYKRSAWLEKKLMDIRKDKYEDNQRMIFVLTAKAECQQNVTNNVLLSLQKAVNKVDISNFFIIVLTNNNVDTDFLQANSSDTVPIVIEQVNDKFVNVDFKENKSEYNSVVPHKVNLTDLTEQQKNLLTESGTFCIYPWIHLHTFPTGESWPCCHSEMKNGPLGSTKENSLQEIWNSNRMKELRVDMLNNNYNNYCTRCYEQEASGFFSGRLSANKHHGHKIDLVDITESDGHLDKFEMTYWDIRFSNLCNLSCRSCGHIFSSSWYKDQIALAGNDYAKNNSALNFAGKFETDMWEQLEPHLDYVEQIYFAGGEPLMMEEHYLILEELERRGRFDVRLIYNTNFTHVKLKDRLVFDYWKKFDSVAVGASLDAMGPRAEYIRKGTRWNVVEENRRQMMEICPGVDFYISPTLSIMNALHLPDFHRDWVEKGFIQAQDLNVNILQDPDHYRIDIAGPELKQQIRELYEQHLEWLRPLDHLNRATVGFESALNYLDANDNSHLQLQFVQKTQQLDRIRNENILDVIPELRSMF